MIPMLAIPHTMRGGADNALATHKLRKMHLITLSFPKHCCHLGGPLLTKSKGMPFSWL